MVRNPLPTSFNRDVPQHVVQKILDHDSPLMTAHYARLSDKTVRDHWEKARKVDAEGRPSRSGPTGRSATPRGRNSSCPGPPRRCRTATASCPWCESARTPTVV